MFSGTPTTVRIHSLRMIGLAIGVCVGVLAPAQDVEAFLAEGDSLLKEGKPQRALEAYNQAVANEASARTYFARARASHVLERNDHFLLDVERALRLDSTLAAAHYLRALYALRALDMKKAIEHAGSAIAHTANDTIRTESLIIRGLAHAEEKHTAEAMADLEAALAAGEDDVEAMRVLARMYDAAGRHEDALRILEHLTVFEPGEVGHWTNRGFELIQLERYDEALPMIEKALELDKDEPVALSNRAYIHYRKGNFSEAEKDVARSLRDYPANAYALRTRALLRLRNGDREKACEDLELARALSGLEEVQKLLEEHCSATSTPGR